MNDKINIFHNLAHKTQRIPGRLFTLGKRSQSNKKPKVTKHLQKIEYLQFRLIIIRHSKKTDVLYLKKRYKFHPLHLDDMLSPLQRPKIDIEDNYLFFVLHFPQFSIKTNRIESKEADFFLIGNDLILIMNQPFERMENIISKISKKREEKQKFLSKGPGFLLYYILDELIDSIFPLVEQIELETDEIDKGVFLEEVKYTVEKISFLRRNIIFFQTIMKPQLAIFKESEELNHPLMTEELKTYFGNITDHISKQWDRLEDLKELTDNLSLTIESYFSFKTNEIIKILTMFSVILLPLTLLTGIYGMNLYFLPLSSHPFALIIISIIMLSVVVVMLIFFKIKKWI